MAISKISLIYHKMILKAHAVLVNSEEEKIL